MSGPRHIPVLLEEAVHALAPMNNGVYVDATFGAGGYSRSILGAANAAVIGLDRDPTAVASGREWAKGYGGRLRIIHTPFGAMAEALAVAGIESVDGVVFDLGVSSMQIDEGVRGFSFQQDGPLDMRMGAAGMTAAELVNEAVEDDLSMIISVYGEDKKARRIARAIVSARAEAPIDTTGRLAEIIEGAVGGRGQEKIHPATRAFQALRIFLNDEIGELQRGLLAAECLLQTAGRLVVVTFHSMEDRIVKRFLNARAGRVANPSRHAPPAAAAAAAPFRLLMDKAVAPSSAEVGDNPRARSAKLRAAVRTDAPIPADEMDFRALGAPVLAVSPGLLLRRDAS
ncbi:MAG: 16S rRNA (cytosine(1402)-N(4))-methyltransferase RsmH [Pseudomonadota bacterium]